MEPFVDGLAGVQASSSKQQASIGHQAASIKHQAASIKKLVRVSIVHKNLRNLIVSQKLESFLRSVMGAISN